MAEPADGREPAIQRRAAHGIVDEVETAATGQARHECLYVLGAIDEARPQCLDRLPARCRPGCEYVGAVGAGDLDRHLADAARPAQNQHGLARPHCHTVNQAFHAVMKTRGTTLASRMLKFGRLERQEIRVYGRVFGE